MLVHDGCARFISLLEANSSTEASHSGMVGNNYGTDNFTSSVDDIVFIDIRFLHKPFGARLLVPE